MNKYLKRVLLGLLVAGITFGLTQYCVVRIYKTERSGGAFVSYCKIPDSQVEAVLSFYRKLRSGEINDEMPWKFVLDRCDNDSWTDKHSQRRSEEDNRFTMHLVLRRGLYAFWLDSEKGGPWRDVRLVNVDAMWKTVSFEKFYADLRTSPIY